MTNEEIIRMLEKAIKTNDSNCINKSIKDSGIIEMLSYVVEKDCHTPLFRVRPMYTKDEYSCSNVSNFSYNPTPKEEGRCNLTNDAVLYTALESRTAVQEMVKSDQAGSNIWLSIWLPKRPIKCLVFLFDSSEIEDEYTKEMHQQIVDSLRRNDPHFEDHLPLYQWISSQFLAENYIFSSQLCFELFKTYDIDGILYPSYAGRTHGLNLALKKEFADTQLCLKVVLSLKITEWNFPSEVKYMKLGESIIDGADNISWDSEVYPDGSALYISERKLRECVGTGGKIIFNHKFGVKI